MKEFVDTVLDESSHYREYEVIVEAADIGDFLNELMTRPWVLWHFEATYYGGGPNPEYIVKFKTAVIK